MMMSGCD